ncbi:hypothetical protein LOZ66_002181 [Ophidiomyces ophidiicola]|nr:hypothetical protein LOZ65_000807 [Ophidiomyces ophidiicola]KAI1940585.1 hypothetical protein LOZ66_002181 [Ophidiomyces ophidiicola]
MIIKRQMSPGGRSADLALVFVIVLASVGLLLLGYFLLRILRAQHPEPPKFVPSFLKKRWKNWVPKKLYGRVPDDSATADGSAVPDRGQNTAYTGAGGTETAAAQVSIDRNTSIRSIMTLPAYSPHPKPSELVIGREGERAGMDVVVEFPETNDEEENRREQEMESLYQIRMTRRREISEREERRRLRREARERGDWAYLEQMRSERQATLANGEQSITAASLLAEHQARGRERRISSVSYAEIGHVRHDGSRLRASSQGSDSRPLLDTAAPIGQGESEPPLIHHRTLSGTSMLSQSTLSDLSHAATPESDIADSAIPQPPPYEHLDLGNAPPYPSPPHRSRDLVRVSNVPSIAVENATPPPSVPTSPVDTRRTAGDTSIPRRS